MNKKIDGSGRCLMMNPKSSFIVISKIFNTSMPIIIASIYYLYLLKTKPTLTHMI